MNSSNNYLILYIYLWNRSESLLLKRVHLPYLFLCHFHHTSRSISRIIPHKCKRSFNNNNGRRDIVKHFLSSSSSYSNSSTPSSSSFLSTQDEHLGTNGGRKEKRNGRIDDFFFAKHFSFFLWKNLQIQKCHLQNVEMIEKLGKYCKLCLRIQGFFNAVVNGGEKSFHPTRQSFISTSEITQKSVSATHTPYSYGTLLVSHDCGPMVLPRPCHGLTWARVCLVGQDRGRFLFSMKISANCGLVHPPPSWQSPLPSL